MENHLIVEWKFNTSFRSVNHTTACLKCQFLHFYKLETRTYIKIRRHAPLHLDLHVCWCGVWFLLFETGRISGYMVNIAS